MTRPTGPLPPAGLRPRGLDLARPVDGSRTPSRPGTSRVSGGPGRGGPPQDGGGGQVSRSEVPVGVPVREGCSCDADLLSRVRPPPPPSVGVVLGQVTPGGYVH